MSSSGYAVYSWIGNEFLASSWSDIAAELYRTNESGIGRLAARDGQYALRAGMFWMRGVYIHILTRRDADCGPDTWVSWDDWHPDCLLPVEFRLDLEILGEGRLKNRVFMTRACASARSLVVLLAVVPRHIVYLRTVMAGEAAVVR